MLRVSRLMICFVGLVLLPALVPGPVFGRVNVETRLQVREEYDSNIYLEPKDEQSDLISILVPGIKLGLDSKMLKADLDYSLEFRVYRDNTQNNQTSLRDAQRILGDATILPGRDFNIGLIDEYSRVVIDERQPVSEGNAIVNRATRNRFEVNPNYHLRRFQTWEIGLGYLYRNINYQHDDQQDSGNNSFSHRFDFSLVKEFSSNVRMNGKYGLEFFNESDAENYTRQDYVVGIEDRLSSRFAIGVEGGVASLDFEHQDDNSGPLWNVWCSYQLAPRLSTNIKYLRNFTNSVDEGVFDTQTGNLTVTYAGRLANSNLQLFTTKSEYLETVREDRSSGISLNTSLPLSNHVDVGVSGNLSYHEFVRVVPADFTEDVVRWGAGCSLGYHVRIGTARIGYNYVSSDSELDVNDYLDHLIFAELAMVF
jgi:hypothetical protein